MPTKREQDGWLPEPVQQIANAAVRCGLVPLIEDGFEDSFSLRGTDDADLGCVGMIGDDVSLFLDETDENDDCIEITGAPAVLAWLTRTTGRYAA